MANISMFFYLFCCLFSVLEDTMSSFDTFPILNHVTLNCWGLELFFNFSFTDEMLSKKIIHSRNLIFKRKFLEKSLRDVPTNLVSGNRPELQSFSFKDLLVSDRMSDNKSHFYTKKTVFGWSMWAFVTLLFLNV